MPINIKLHLFKFQFWNLKALHQISAVCNYSIRPSDKLGQQGNGYLISNICIIWDQETFYNGRISRLNASFAGSEGKINPSGRLAAVIIILNKTQKQS